MAFISAEATSGTYDSGTGLWTVGDLGSGAADTLRVLLQLTNDTPFSVRISAESRGSEREVDPVPGNNQASFTIIIS